MISHEEICERARQIWEREGCPQGRDMQHWLQAETELQEERAREEGVPVTAAVENAGMAANLGKENGSRKKAPRPRR